MGCWIIPISLRTTTISRWICLILPLKDEAFQAQNKKLLGRWGSIQKRTSIPDKILNYCHTRIHNRIHLETNSLRHNRINNKINFHNLIPICVKHTNINSNNPNSHPNNLANFKIPQSKKVQLTLKPFSKNKNLSHAKKFGLKRFKYPQIII